MARARARWGGGLVSGAGGLAGAVDPEMENYRPTWALVAGLRCRKNLCLQPAAGSRGGLRRQPRGRQDSVEPVLPGSIQDEPRGGEAWRGAEIHARFRRRQIVYAGDQRDSLVL